MEFKIEKNIPMPDSEKSKGTGYFAALRKMEVGDSFKFDRELRNRVSGAASYLKFRRGLEFIIKKTSNKECRCWRVK